jgi:hypothetical protein
MYFAKQNKQYRISYNTYSYSKIIRLQKLLQNISTKPQNSNVLGRWALENCDKKTNSKIDWSNTDHCGTCSFDQLEKTPKESCLENPKVVRTPDSQS